MRMKKLWIGMIGLVLMAATQAGAQLFSQDFETNPGYSGTQDFAVGAAGSGAAGGYVAFDVWAGTTDIGITQTNGALQVDSNTSGGSARNRGFAVTIDTSAAVAGVYTVSFDVTNFVAGTGTAGMAVHEGSGLDTQYITWDTGGNSSADNWPRNQGTAPSTVIGDTGSRGTGITADGPYSFNVTLTEAGVAGDWMALAFAQIRTTSSATAPTFDIDNVLVEMFSGGNLPPVADDKSVDVVQNEFVDITLTGSDPEGSNLTYNVGSPTNGTLVLVINQTYTYTPDTNYFGPDSFTYTVNDGDTNSEPATVSISVNLNEQPVADSQGVALEKNTSVEITLTGSDLETANSNLTYNVGSPTNGSLLLVTNQTYTYTPDTDYVGPDGFTFTVNDGKTNSEPATVSINVFEQPVEGTVLYEEDFSTDPGYTNNNDTAIGAAGSSATYFTFGEYNGTPDIGVTTDTGVLHIDSNTSGGSARSRGLSVFVDTSAAGPGTYTVSFEVSNWVDGTGTAGLKAVEGSGLDTLYVQLKNSGNNDAGTWPTFGGTAPNAELGNTWGAGAAGTGITNNGTYSFTVDLTEAGVAGDYLALALTQVRSTSGALAPKFDVDNVWVGVGTPPVSGDTYSAWALSYGLTGVDDENDDEEPDGLDNLMEYALGGNPTNDDAAAVAPETYTADAGGTNWFYHVYNENQDPSLTFAVGATPNLVTTAADTNDVELVGESAESSGFKAVTNRTEAATDAKFIQLDVTQ